MPATLYYVKPGDTLWRISKRFGTTIETILNANVICNSNLIFPGEVLLIPSPETPSFLKAGGFPYYVVRPGDTLWCLAQQFGTTVTILALSNNIRDPNIIFAGQELLVIGERPDPAQLKQQWENLGGWPSCDQIPPISIHGIYYNGSFSWEALGQDAIPYLLQLIDNPCNIVRIYTVISLARIARNDRVKNALRAAADDPDPSVSRLVPLALRRIELGEQERKNVHLVIDSVPLHEEPNLASPSIQLPAGTEVAALRWLIPSPTEEEGPRGGILIYDRFRVLKTGQTGYIPRVGFDEIVVI